jgi:uncharacterized protein YdaU (DUF1376 family)
MSEKNALRWCEFDIDDWLESDFVNSLDPVEYQIYHKLLLRQFRRGWLPTDKRALASVAGCTPQVMSKVWPRLAHKFVETDDGYVNEKMDAKRKRALKMAEKNSTKAQHAAKKRWEERAQGTLPEEGEEDAPSISRSNAPSNAAGNATLNTIHKELQGSSSLQDSGGRAGARKLVHGGPPEGWAGPIARIIRDDETRQEWVCEKGDRYLRVHGVTSHKGKWREAVRDPS